MPDNLTDGTYAKSLRRTNKHGIRVRIELLFDGYLYTVFQINDGVQVEQEQYSDRDRANDHYMALCYKETHNPTTVTFKSRMTNGE